ncbi:MAG: ATP-binding protein, partial [Phycisphaerae bacterium]|nr:ATP-binding protein [Phycisphaerae bacterium]
MNSNQPLHCLTISSELSSARQVEQRLITELRRQNYPDDCLFAVRLALEEALSNAIKHGNRLDPDKTVTVRFAVEPEKVQL